MDTLSIRGALCGQNSVTIGVIRKTDLVEGEIAIPVVLKIGGYNTASLYFREGRKLTRISGGFDINNPFNWIEGYLAEAMSEGAVFDCSINL